MRENDTNDFWLFIRNNGEQNSIFKVLEENKTCQSRELYPEVFFINKGTTLTSSAEWESP